MALGGYKFAGYKCTKPEGATDAQWVLLMHKCKVKAFLASNEAASAGWAFDPTYINNGQAAFETYGNAIHSLDEVGYNLVSFFKHGDGDAYFCIITSTYRGATENLSNGCINSLYLLYINTISGCNNTQFVGISETPFTPLNVRSGADLKLRLAPVCGKNCTGTNYNNAPAPSNWSANSAYPSYSSFCAGFAIKNKNIIAFNGVSPSDGNIGATVCSVGGFSGLSNSNDENNLFAINLNGQSSTASGETLLINGISSARGIIVLNDAGSAGFGNIRKSDTAFYNVGTQYLPYESVFIINILNSVFLNYAKGQIAIDLLSLNSQSSSGAQPIRLQAYANGNYLCIANNQTSLASIQGSIIATTYTALYCGWDPSNPDITSEDAWTAYDGT